MNTVVAPGVGKTRMNAPAAVNNDNPAEDEMPPKPASVKGVKEEDDDGGGGQDVALKDQPSSPTEISKKASDDSDSIDGSEDEESEEEDESSVAEDSEEEVSAGAEEVSDASAETEGQDDAAVAETEQEEEDEEIRLAMEMAMAAAQNPRLSPAEIQKLVAGKNQQASLVEGLKKEKEAEQKKKAEEAAKSRREKSWWGAAAKRAEAVKDRAERRYYADRIRKDKQFIEIRRKYRFLKKTYKAHRLQGNRVETRHAFKRQRMEKHLMQTTDRLTKTQKLFTQSSYNVQEYLKAMMRASKKWRKKGTDEELMLEAQLCRNMHQMLALEKQKVKGKKGTKEMKKYLQRCKGWLSEKKDFCEMNVTTLDSTQNSITMIYKDILKRQDQLIMKLKASKEFQDVDLSDVDTSNMKLPVFPTYQSPLRGLPINDSIRVKKEQLEKAEGMTPEEKAEQIRKLEEAAKREALVAGYFKTKAEEETANHPEVYIDTKDDVSVSSRLSDPDGSGHDMNDSSSLFKFGSDAPWVSSDEEGGDKKKSPEDETEGDDNKAKATAKEKKSKTDKKSSKKSKKKSSKDSSKESTDEAAKPEKSNYDNDDNVDIAPKKEDDGNDDDGDVAPEKTDDVQDDEGGADEE